MSRTLISKCAKVIRSSFGAAALILAACGGEPGLGEATESLLLDGTSDESDLTGDAVAAHQPESNTTCTACADDEWGSYVRTCCTTFSNGSKICQQEACRRPNEDTLPIGPIDPGDFDVVEHDEPDLSAFR